MTTNPTIENPQTPRPFTREELAEQVATVAALRDSLAAVTRELQDIESVSYMAHQTSYDWRAHELAALAEAEQRLRDATLAHFLATGEPKPAPGVEVRLFSSIEYDEAAALAWAKEKQLALVPESLDRKAFEKLAKATPLPFVTEKKTPRPQIASDLSVVVEGVRR